MKIEVSTSICRGDTANTSLLKIPNHLGTHVDAPLHFFDGGKAVSDYSADFWVFHNVQIFNIACGDGDLITSADLPVQVKDETELLLLRTGFEAYRGTPRYWQKNPGIDPELAIWLRSNFLNVRAVGIDTISIASRLHREKGRLAHSYFLDPEGENDPILLLEDMALSSVPPNLSMVVVAPILACGADGAPCTVIGFVS